MVFGMTYYQICLYFLTYSFLGWCLEVAFHAFKTHRVINRGFLNGPVCPVYGFGVLAVLCVVHFLPQSGGTSGQSVHPLVLFVIGSFLATLIELLGGFLLDRLFHARWWDYSNYRWNFHGYICPLYSGLWGIGIVVVVRFLHPSLGDGLVDLVPVWAGWWILLVLYAGLLTDFVVSVLVMLQLNKELEELDEIRRSMRTISNSLSKLVGESAFAAEDLIVEYGPRIMESAPVQTLAALRERGLVSEAAPEMAAEAVAEVTAEAASEEKVEAATEAVDETATEAASEAEAAVASEAAIEAAAENGMDAEPEIVAENDSDTAAEMTAGIEIDAAAEVAAENGIDTAAERVDENGIDTAAEMAAENSIDAAAEMTAENSIDAAAEMTAENSIDAAAEMTAASDTEASDAGSGEDLETYPHVVETRAEYEEKKALLQEKYQREIALRKDQLIQTKDALQQKADTILQKTEEISSARREDLSRIKDASVQKAMSAAQEAVNAARLAGEKAMNTARKAGEEAKRILPGSGASAQTAVPKERELTLFEKLVLQKRQLDREESAFFDRFRKKHNLSVRRFLRFESRFRHNEYNDLVKEVQEEIKKGGA